MPHLLHPRLLVPCLLARAVTALHRLCLLVGSMKGTGLAEMGKQRNTNNWGGFQTVLCVCSVSVRCGYSVWFELVLWYREPNPALSA